MFGWESEVLRASEGQVSQWGVMYDLGNLYLNTLLWKVWPHHLLLYSNENKKGFLTVMYSSIEGMCKPVNFFSGLKRRTI